MDEITSDLIDAYISGKTNYPTEPAKLGAVIAAATPEQRAQLRSRIGIEINLADFGKVWSTAISHANKLSA